ERGGVADVAYPLTGERRNQSDAERALDRHVVAEAAGQHQLRDPLGRDAGDVLEHRDAGGDRALRELDLADVVLGEHDLLPRAGFARPEHDDLTFLAAHHDPLGEPGRERVAPVHLDQPGPVDDPAVEQAPQESDDDGAADAERVGLADRVHVDVVVAPDAIDGAERAAHAVTDLAALERRPGGCRAGPEAVARAQQYLSVGPDI